MVRSKSGAMINRKIIQQILPLFCVLVIISGCLQDNSQDTSNPNNENNPDDDEIEQPEPDDEEPVIDEDPDDGEPEPDPIFSSLAELRVQP